MDSTGVLKSDPLPLIAQAGCPRNSGRDARATNTVRHYVLESSISPKSPESPIENSLRSRFPMLTCGVGRIGIKWPRG